ncbi:MerR family transcriptional regulator [Lacisediminihabitans changchengi]|uniref:MerR family transcriptional regulator n=1 Tax=Lacisediminihabitans changchengi TaxID=2787634 RepID=A0A934SNB0_9MICO|nr:MerR family transcriptional regulator [Lacisediminihabitans changchengi]MBK4348535.1 MerR family transcriptional regulator [Lacisediminihabitans changchengi]
MDWSIQQIARLSGTTSRTLRHYGQLGLLAPSRIGANGYRYYDAASLVRLQRILLLRDLGLGLPAIGELLSGQTDDADALGAHLRWLRQEKDRLDRQIGTVESTIEKLRTGEGLMAEEALDGFDHTVYRDEVEERWGAKSYADGDRWWRGMSDGERARWRERQDSLLTGWREAAASGIPVGSEGAQALARRQFDWLSGIPGLPAVDREYFVGLGDMYVADERFAANYGGVDGATFVRDAMRIFADREL